LEGNAVVLLIALSNKFMTTIWIYGLLIIDVYDNHCSFSLCPISFFQYSTHGHPPPSIHIGAMRAEGEVVGSIAVVGLGGGVCIFLCDVIERDI
jgi:hypothetical protein